MQNEDPGLLRGHQARAAGSRKKTAKQLPGPSRGVSPFARITNSVKKHLAKRPQLTAVNISIEQLWTEFRSKLDEIFDRRTAGPYESMDPHDLLDLHLRPYVDRMLELLLEEDEALVGQPGSIGDRMEFFISNQIFIEMEALAQSNQPEGMFSLAIGFLIQVVCKVRAMPLIHNSQVHKTMLRIFSCILVSLRSDVIDVNDSAEMNLQVGTVLSLLEAVTQLSLNRDPEISKFFIEEVNQAGKTRGTHTYVPVQVILEFLKKESVNQGPNFKRLLRSVLVKQLLIKNEKVKRFLVLESDFSLNVLSKLRMFLGMVPEDVPLVRLNFSSFPDESQIYKQGLSLDG